VTIGQEMQFGRALMKAKKKKKGSVRFYKRRFLRKYSIVMIYTPKHVLPVKHVPFEGLRNIRLHITSETPKNLCKMRGNMNFAAKSV